MKEASSSPDVNGKSWMLSRIMSRLQADIRLWTCKIGLLSSEASSAPPSALRLPASFRAHRTNVINLVNFVPGGEQHVRWVFQSAAVRIQRGPNER
jgi:hypothetical protein